MPKLMLTFIVIALWVNVASAQRVEIFGGYQFTHLEPAFNGSGWNASLSADFKHVLGITGDFSGAYGRGLNFYTYAVGPTLTARLPVIQPFVHALFGGATLTDGGSTTGFAMLLGGGLDAGLRKGIGIRIIQYVVGMELRDLAKCRSSMQISRQSAISSARTGNPRHTTELCTS